MAKPLKNALKTDMELGPYQYDITPESAHSAVVLLQSKEPEILRNVRGSSLVFMVTLLHVLKAGPFY